MGPSGVLFAVLGVAVFVAALVLLARAERARRARIDAERDALARSLGMSYDASTTTLAGVLDGFPASVKWVTTVVSTGKTVMVITTTKYLFEGFPRSIVIRPEGLGTGVRKALGAGERIVGDRAFDDAVFFQAEDLDAALFRDPDVRRCAIEVVSTGAAVRDGEIALDKSGHDTAETVRARLAAFAALAVSVRDARTRLPALLAAGRDASAMRLLVERFAGAPETLRASEELRASVDPELRVLSAIGLRDAAALRALLRDPALPIAPRREALAAIVPTETDADLEPALIELLRDSDIQTKCNACRALGVCGSVAAVEAIHVAAKGILTDSSLKLAANEAVVRIQGRAENAAPGQLQLSDPDPARGAVSIARKPQGST